MSKRINQARLTLEELHELKWLLGGVLALLSLWSLSSLELGSELFLFLVTLTVCVGVIKPAIVAAIPSRFWRFFGPGILVFVVVDFGVGYTNFFLPLMRMVILLILYRALSPRIRREDLQLVLLCLFGIVVSGALTVSLLFALQILLFTPAAMALLFVICVMDRGAETLAYQPDWKDFSWLQLVKRVWAVLDIRVLAMGGVLFAFVVSVSTGLFVLIPRFNLDQAIPFLPLQSKSKSGFSDSVQLGSVAEISEDETIALRVDVPGIESIHSTPYWRMLVLDEYRDGGFKLSEGMRKNRNPKPVSSLQGWSGLRFPLEHRRAQLWTFYFQGGVSQYLPLPGSFYSLRFAAQQDIVVLPELRVLGLNAVQQSTFSYRVEDLIWDVRMPAADVENNAFLNLSDAVDRGARKSVQYPLTNLALDLNSADRERLAELNQTLIAESGDLSAAQYSQLVTSYLRQRFRYSLSPSALSGKGDPVVEWLTEGRAGHCEFFAGAFVLLAREAGYPARMAVGFLGGGWNSLENFFVVRNSDAHAWVEIYDAQSREWLRVDPTPGASPNDPELSIPASFDFETGMAAWVDSLRIQWYRRIVNFDENDQLEIATSMIDHGDALLKAISTRFREIGASLQEWIMNPFSRGNILRGSVLLAFAMGLFILWRTRDRIVHSWFRLLRRPQAMDPNRKQAARILKKIRNQIEVINAEDLRWEDFQRARAELERVRFGQSVSDDVARSIFKQARGVLRMRKRV